jgi:hypothetical protein
MAQFNAHNTPELAVNAQLREKVSYLDHLARGAQADVFMLSDPELCTDDTPDYDYTIPRVAKIALGQLASAHYVQEKIGLDDPYETAAKVSQLQHDQARTYQPIVQATSRSPADDELYWRLGHPKWINGTLLVDRLAAGEYTTETAYSQDYAQPAAELFAKLDPNNLRHTALAQNIFDQYVQIQRLLIRYGLFDTSFKLLDNYGVDEDGALILLDFGELTLGRNEALQAIRSKEWTDLPNRDEQSHLATAFQAAFNNTLEQWLTPASLKGWGAAYTDLVRQQSETVSRRDVSQAARSLVLHRAEQRGLPRITPASQLWAQAMLDSSNQPNILPGSTALATMPELDYSARMPKQFARIGQGAQYRVYLLTNPWLSHPITPDVAYVPPRAIKHALSDPETLAYLRDTLRIQDPEAQQRKMAELRSALANTLTPLFMEAIRDKNRDDSHDSQLYDLLGWPKIHSVGQLDSGEVVITDYTQDYVQPVADLLPQLDWQRPEHQTLGRHLVDQYVDLQLLLIEYGYFDGIIKLVNNCGVDDHAKLLLLDPGELMTNKQAALRAITEKVWEKIPGRPEYDDLPAPMQTYLNQELERRLTPAVVAARWGIRKRPMTDYERHEAVNNLMDQDIRETWIHHLLTASPR